MCRSVPQIPPFLVRIMTSLIDISGSGTSSIHSPGSALLLTIAFIRFSRSQEKSMIPNPQPARETADRIPFVFLFVCFVCLYVCNVVLLRVFRVFGGWAFIKRTTNHTKKNTKQKGVKFSD